MRLLLSLSALLSLSLATLGVSAQTSSQFYQSVSNNCANGANCTFPTFDSTGRMVNNVDVRTWDDNDVHSGSSIELRDTFRGSSSTSNSTISGSNVSTSGINVYTQPAPPPPPPAPKSTMNRTNNTSTFHTSQLSFAKGYSHAEIGFLLEGYFHTPYTSSDNNSRAPQPIYEYRMRRNGSWTGWTSVRPQGIRGSRNVNGTSSRTYSYNRGAHEPALTIARFPLPSDADRVQGRMRFSSSETLYSLRCSSAARGPNAIPREDSCSGSIYGATEDNIPSAKIERSMVLTVYP